MLTLARQHTKKICNSAPSLNLLPFDTADIKNYSLPHKQSKSQWFEYEIINTVSTIYVKVLPLLHL